MPEKFARYDSADHLKTGKEIAAYLDEALKQGAEDPAFLAHALGVVARSRNMSQLSRKTGVSREGLYKALSNDGNPSLATVLKVTKALGLELSVKPARKAA